jgi:DNA polymerase I-like protein with 3'-5' exonuclease and polymerase domains
MTWAIDFETYLIGDGAVFPKPICLSAYDGQQTLLMNREDAREWLKGKLNSELFIAHNAVFECGVIVTHYPELCDKLFDALDNGLIYCTKINEALWNIQRDKQIHKLTLAGLVEYYFQKDISSSKTNPDAWRLRYSELDGIPIEQWPIEASQYAIDDSIWAYKVYQNQKPIKKDLALKSAVYLNLMGAQGMQVNKERVLKLESEIWEYLTPRYDYLVKEGFCDYILHQKQPRKQIKKLKEYIESLHLDLMHTDKGGTATSGEALAFYLAQKDNVILKSFSELSRYEKILTAYINHLKGAERIYTQYSTTKNTGRTSSSSSKLFSSINIQQIPRKVADVTYDVRNCFIPKKGFKICSIDYSGLELCSAAHQLYSTVGFSFMRKALNEGDKPTDMHSRLAAKIKKVSYEDFMLHKSEPEYKDARQKAKPINLGFPGGIGYDTMRHLMWRDGIKTSFQVLETARNKNELYYYLTNLAAPDIRIQRRGKNEYALVQDELVVLKRYIYDLYPELEQFLKEKHNDFLTGKTKLIKNEFGEWEEEPMYMYDCYGFKRDNCTYTALCNGLLMQTPAAIGAQKAVNKLYRTFHRNDNIIPHAFIHDEVVFEVAEGRTDLIEQAANIMIEEMQTVLTSVRIAVEASMSDYWQKADGFWTQTYFKDAIVK